MLLVWMVTIKLSLTYCLLLLQPHVQPRQQPRQQPRLLPLPLVLLLLLQSCHTTLAASGCEPEEEFLSITSRETSSVHKIVLGLVFQHAFSLEIFLKNETTSHPCFLKVTLIKNNSGEFLNLTDLGNGNRLPLAENPWPALEDNSCTELIVEINDNLLRVTARKPSLESEGHSSPSITLRQKVSSTFTAAVVSDDHSSVLKWGCQSEVSEEKTKWTSQHLLCVSGAGVLLLLVLLLVSLGRCRSRPSRPHPPTAAPATPPATTQHLDNTVQRNSLLDSSDSFQSDESLHRHCHQYLPGDGGSQDLSRVRDDHDPDGRGRLPKEDHQAGHNPSVNIRRKPECPQAQSLRDSLSMYERVTWWWGDQTG
ncbi:uncharacterized protein [Procambarus clarkii]|uniref:uncharacterized protein isoform X2 n=1 Tax=Procambarus clarkii TaxID=6728 RepID=UPI001E675066|nr:uncharacterized protein LOC123762044 isoform X2 [Procambarus clarkii]